MQRTASSSSEYAIFEHELYDSFLNHRFFVSWIRIRLKLRAYSNSSLDLMRPVQTSYKFTCQYPAYFDIVILKAIIL